MTRDHKYWNKCNDLKRITYFIEFKCLILKQKSQMHEILKTFQVLFSDFRHSS